MSGLVDKVKNLIRKDPSKLDSALQKAGEFVNQKTDGKYSDAIDKAQGYAKQAADKAIQAKDDVSESVEKVVKDAKEEG